MSESEQLQVSEEAAAIGREETRGWEPFRNHWQKTIMREQASADKGASRWQERNIAATLISEPTRGHEDWGTRRGSIELSLSEDGGEVILSVIRHQGNGPGSDIEDITQVLLSIPEAEALAMGILVRRPGRLSIEYGESPATGIHLQLPDPTVF